MKTKLLSLLMISMVCLLLSNAVSAQKPDIKKIYSELPDEFFSLRIFDEEPLFNLYTRNEYLSEEYLDSKDGLYKANLYDYNEYYDGEESDTSLTIYSDFTISINQESGLASYRFEFEGNSNKLDMIIIEKDANFYLAIFEQYNPGMGVPAMVEINYFPIRNSEVINEKHALELPKLDWNSFYSDDDLKKINTKMLDGVNIPYLMNLEVVEGAANLSLIPDLVGLTWQMSQTIEFKNNEELFEYERYMQAETILGFEDLMEAKPVYILFKDLIK